MPHGGARPNSGPKKGSKRPHTLIKDMQREHLRQQVFAVQDQIVAAQVRKALGLAHFFLRDDKGQFKRITDEAEIEQALNSGNPNAFWIDTKDPDTAAAKDLLDRALDKPVEAVEVEHKGGIDLRWLDTPK